MENNEFITNLFNFLNQPFVIAIGVVLVIGIFALLIVHELSLGKKSMKQLKQSVSDYGNYERDLRKDIIYQQSKLINEKDDYLKLAQDKFNDFYNENDKFRNFVIKSLEYINNKGIKELLEEYKNGKAEETKDN